MPNAGRQIWEITIPRDVELTPLKNRNEQEQNKNVEKGTKRIIENQRKMNEKKERWMKGYWKMVLHKKDPWSDHPKTQIDPTYPFFRNPEPRPTLRAVKVHFDWIWILRLKRFFLREFS